MSFSSPGFLFAFMPAVFGLYFLLPGALRNAFLFVASTAFYFVDAGPIVYVLLGSVVLNHIWAQGIARTSNQRWRDAILWSGVLVNLIPLIYYKYWNFLASSAVSVYATMGGTAAFDPLDVLLPAGISFFTFQGISYIVDVYRREVQPTGSLVDFGMYHTLFPQLIAGPIVRYTEVADRIRDRRITLEDIQAGIVRFCIGLGKKMIIADNAGVVADRMFALPAAELSTAAAWLGIAAYTLQILFDFSGYSDMAIGMARMLGFRFPENFDQPYRSRSITEFWRRWHMTLSRWFRDYLYIPLGGNRAGPLRTYLNLTIVFALCGLWHGASVNFLVWGLWHGLLLVMERIAAHRWGWRPSGVAGWGATLLAVMIGWVFFRAPTMDAASSYLMAMAGAGGDDVSRAAVRALTYDKVSVLLLGAAISLLPRRLEFVRGDVALGPVAQFTTSVGALVILIYSAALVAANGFNPFIYFRF